MTKRILQRYLTLSQAGLRNLHLDRIRIHSKLHYPCDEKGGRKKIEKKLFERWFELYEGKYIYCNEQMLKKASKDLIIKAQHRLYPSFDFLYFNLSNLYTLIFQIYILCF